MLQKSLLDGRAAIFFKGVFQQVLHGFRREVRILQFLLHRSIVPMRDRFLEDGCFGGCQAWRGEV